MSYNKANGIGCNFFLFYINSWVYIKKLFWQISSTPFLISLSKIWNKYIKYVNYKVRKHLIVIIKKNHQSQNDNQLKKKEQLDARHETHLLKRASVRITHTCLGHLPCWKQSAQYARRSCYRRPKSNLMNLKKRCYSVSPLSRTIVCLAAKRLFLNT